MDAPPPAATVGECRYPVLMLRRGRVGLFVLAVALAAAACSGGPAPSFDPTGDCVTDGRAPGAYPELEALVPDTFRGVAPGTLDSGRNCTVTNLGILARLGIAEVRFAGATWSFGAERAAVLAVFRTHGLTVGCAGRLLQGERQARRREPRSLASTSPTIAGRPGQRLDTKTGERIQTVVVWPSATPDVVNVVITNDLPDARIQEAIDAFGGA